MNKALLDFLTSDRKDGVMMPSRILYDTDAWLADLACLSAGQPDEVKRACLPIFSLVRRHRRRRRLGTIELYRRLAGHIQAVVNLLKKTSKNPEPDCTTATFFPTLG
jgi:hypothetical protein